MFSSCRFSLSNIFGSGGSHRGDVDQSALLDNSHQLPALEFRLGRTFDHLNRVAEFRLVVFVVDMANRTAFDVFAVLGMLDQTIDLDPPALVHLVARDNAYELFLGHAFWLCATLIFDSRGFLPLCLDSLHTGNQPAMLAELTGGV